MLDAAPSVDLVQSPAIELDPRGIGRSFVDAIVACDFDAIEALFAPDARFRAVIPAGFKEASTAGGARSIIEQWFGASDALVLLDSDVDLVADRLTIGYRIELTEDGERRIVQQHVVATVDGGELRDVALLCSGFRPVVADPGGRLGPVGPHARLDATGLSCATLTPTISATVRGLDFGAVLEIVTDDPDAEEGLRSWTRLTGNELVGAEKGPGSVRRFAIRRTPRDAAAGTRKGTD